MPCFNQASTSASSAPGKEVQKSRPAQTSYAIHASTNPHQPRHRFEEARAANRSPGRSPRNISNRSERLPASQIPPQPPRTVATFPRRRPQGLRRRSQTLNPLIYMDQHPVSKRTPSRPKQGTNGLPAMSGAPMDLIPQASGSNMDLRRFVERQYQSLPSNNMDGRMPRPGGAHIAKSMPHVEKMRQRRSAQFGIPTGASRRPIPKDHGINKAAYAAQEIARHDLGPYPTGVPKPRQPSAAFDRPRRSPRQRSSLLGARRSALERNRSFENISDRDVLRGLHIAAAAACDESLDELVHEKTGVHVRRFLADLMAFESLGFKQPGDDSEERARRRRSQMRKLKQHVRNSREVKRQSALLT